MKTTRFCLLVLVLVSSLPKVTYAQSDGVISPISPSFRFDQTLSRGMNGEVIVKLQETLIRLGVYDGPVTGYFGPLTEAAVRRLQELNGLEAVGIFGARTRAVINAKLERETTIPPSPKTPLALFQFTQLLSPGMRNKDVQELQTLLTALGIYDGPLTGYFGPLTAAAVRQYQIRRGLASVGSVGPKTREALNVEITNRAAKEDITPPLPQGDVVPTLPLPVPVSPTPSPPQASPPPMPPPPETSLWLNVPFMDFAGGDSYGEKPSMTWYRNGYGIVWVGNDGIPGAENIFFSRIDLAGKRILNPVRLTQHGTCECVTANAPNLAWNGKFAAVWVENAAAGGTGEGPALRFALLENNGGKSAEVTIAAPKDAPSTKRPSIKSRADNFAIAWEKADGTRMFAALTLDGKVFLTNPKVASDAEWDVVNTPTFDGRVIEEKGKIYYELGTTRELVSTVSGENTAPYITFGSTSAIVWQNRSDGITQFYFAVRLGGAGVQSPARLAASLPSQ